MAKKQKVRSRNLSRLVVKDNRLINAKYSFSTLESRIFVLAISQISRDEQDLRSSYRIYFKDLTPGEFKGDIHARARETTKELIKKVVVIEEEQKDTQVPLIIAATHYKNRESYFDVTFHEKIKPYLLQLKERFTAYALENVLPLRSRYSVRLYEMLKQYETIGERTMAVMEIKDILDILEEYERYSDFKRYVLLRPQKEINQHTDITFSFEEIKKGRRIDRIRFVIRKNPKNIAQALLPANDAVDSKLVNELSDMGLTRQQIEKLLAEKSEERIQVVLVEVQNRYKETVGSKKEIKNLPAYLFRALKSDKGKSKPKIVQEAQEAEKQAQERLDKQREQAAAEARDRRLIEQFRDDYRAYRKELGEKRISEMNEDDWLAFEEYVGANPYLRKNYIQGGKLQRDGKDIHGWLSNFLIGRDLPDTPEGFMAWTYQNHGYQLAADKASGEIKYKITGKQEKLF